MNSQDDDLPGEIGHELRNPLTSILALSDALHDEVFGPLDPGQKQALDSIRDCVRRQNGLIADLVSLRRLETAAPMLRPGPCRLAAVIYHAVAEVAGLFQSRNLQVVTKIEPEELEVRADGEALRRVVTELLAGGVRASDVGGTVTLRAETTDQHAGLKLSVLVAPASTKIEMNEMGGSDPGVERKLRKLGPIGHALLRGTVALLGGRLAFQEPAEGHLHLLAWLPMEI